MNRYEFYTNLQNWNSKELYHHGILGQKWGVRRYQNEDGSLTEEGKLRYLNPDGTINNKGRRELSSSDQLKITQAHYREQSEKGIGEYADNAIYDENRQKEKLSEAKSKKMYDLSFVETIQNAENLSDDDLQREYAAYLKNPRKYMEEFSVDSQGNIKNSRSGVKTQEQRKEDLNKKENVNAKSENELKEDLKEEAKSAFGPRATKEEEERFWKALAEEYQKGNLKNSNSKPEEKKENKTENRELSKEEKKELKKAKQEAYKTASKGHTARNLFLTGPVLGAISDWGMVNKAIKELGFTSEDKKNLTASDWNRINEKIQDLRGSKKKSK